MRYLKRLGVVFMAAFVLSFAISQSHGAEVCSHGPGKICKNVAPYAQRQLQCVINYVQAHGIKIVSMRGFGKGTVKHSMHPSGGALDINQTDRDVTHPHIPREISNGAGEKCGVISGARWDNADNGHWNMPEWAFRSHRKSKRVRLAQHR